MRYEQLALQIISNLKNKALTLALTAATLSIISGVAPSPAYSATPDEMINIIEPTPGTGTTTSCGEFCFLSICPCMPDVMLDTAYQEHRNGFILGSFFTSTADVHFRQWTDQLVQAWLIQARMIGGFYDAQNQSNAQLALQRLQAEALRDYTPGAALCQFGTLTRSLGATTERMRTNQIALSEINLARSVGRFNNIGGTGRGQDNMNRMTTFIETMCDNSHDNSAMAVVCANGVVDARFNRDIDYSRTLAVPETLRVDFTNNGLTTTEEDLIALGRNLYGNNIFLKRIGRYDLDSGTGQILYELMRSVIAKRSLAQNSFNAYAAMKALGPPASHDYVNTVLENLGMSEEDRDAYLANFTPPGGGEAQPGNPSYYAQMDILTKRIYQNPGFYAELMDKKANVSRQQAAMEGLELMQDRDIYTSSSRSEQLLGLLVEMEAIKLQSKVLNNAKTK